MFVTVHSVFYLVYTEHFHSYCYCVGLLNSKLKLFGNDNKLDNFITDCV